MDINILGRNWRCELQRRVSETQRSLFICSPYVTQEGCDLILSSCSPEFRKNGEINLLSDLSPLNLIQQSTQPRALRSLLGSMRTGRLWHLPRVHAKVFVFDVSYAVVTSANLTAGGLYRNSELGMGTTNKRAIDVITKEVHSLTRLSAAVDDAKLNRYCDLADQVKEEMREDLRSVVRDAKVGLDRAIQNTEDELLRWRIAGGKVTPLFAKTIMYFLRRLGPMSTRQLHPLIQSMHPDLCDDTVDRVIDGIHYGKRWKHWVRSAQHRLKAAGRIRLASGVWHLGDDGVGDECQQKLK